MTDTPNFTRQLAAEFIGTAFLLATVIGSGIMAERLADGNVALALLGNTIATGAILVVLILGFGAISGAHFNPAVTLAFALQRKFPWSRVPAFIGIQVIAGLVGMLAAHAMFEEPLWQLSETARSGPAQWLSEIIATFGLLMAIFTTVRYRPETTAYAVGLYITAAYWFTASTSFANPAVTIARTFTNTFSGIAAADAPMFIAAQLIGAGIAAAVFGLILRRP